MAKVMLLHYNNYYNKEVKRENSVEDYRPYRLSQNYASSEWNQVAFNPNDGTITTIVLNWFGEQADYCIISDNGIDVDSRWFVLEAVRDLKGQYTYTLKRDVLADYLGETLNATAFIRKGVVDNSSPLAFIPEDVSLNRIKTKQVPLYDQSGCPWVVIYYDKKYLDGSDKQITWNSLPKVDGTYATRSDIPNSECFGGSTYYIASGNDVKWNGKVKTSCTIRNALGILMGPKENYQGVVMSDSSETYYYNSGVNAETLRPDKETLANIPQYGVIDYGIFNWNEADPSIGTDIMENMVSTIRSTSGFSLKDSGLTVSGFSLSGSSTYREVTKETHYELFRSNGKIVYIEDEQAYYMISATPTSRVIRTTIQAVSVPEVIKNAVINSAQTTYNGAPTSIALDGEWRVDVYAYELQPRLTRVYEGEVSLTLSKELIKTIDAPYNIMAVPYSDTFKFVNPTNPSEYITTSKRLALDIGSQIMTVIGTANVYDVQLVPYTELDFFNGRDSRVYPSLDANAQYIYSGNTVIGISYNLERSQFEKPLNIQIPVAETKYGPKHFEACYTVRLNSPNYASIYEYSPAKNNSIYKFYSSTYYYSAGPFRTYCTLKPYSPYIQVWPIAGQDSLYGGDFTDARGLICSGDFGLTTLSSAWTDYVVANKNFNEIFDRQIEKMDIDYKLSQTSKGISMASGLVGGGIGLAASAATGNVVGALASGAGMINSLGSGIGQMVVGKKQHEADKQYNITQHNLQLGNVQAMPNSISKISGININNLGVPILEVYECTPEEKRHFSFHQIFEGMNVGVIGRVGDYIKSFSVSNVRERIPGITDGFGYAVRPFIQADIMRLKDIKDDTHVVNAIAEEVANGFYINTNLLYQGGI